MMTENTEVQLGTIGFLGDKYIEIIPGTKGLPVIKEGSVVATRDVGSAPAMFKAGEQALDKAGSIAANVDTLLKRMNAGEGTLGKMAVDDEMYVKLTKLLGELTILTKGLQENQGTMVSSIERMSNAIADLTEQVNENRGTLGLLVSDPDLYNNLAATTSKLDSIMFKINRAEGSLGMLVNDTALYAEVTTLLTRVSNLVSDIEKNPRKYFKFSVF
jgi:phospholipid/cholesterol/gamma-HCH transport system substrate-binding protein